MCKIIWYRGTLSIGQLVNYNGDLYCIEYAISNHFKALFHKIR